MNMIKEIKIKSDSKYINLIKKDIFMFFQQVSNDFDNKIILIKMGFSQFYIVNDAKLAQFIISKTGRDFEKLGELRAIGDILGEGVLTAKGKNHLNQRRNLLPMFNKANINSFVEFIRNITLQKINSWKQNEVINIMDFSTQLSLDILGKVLFGDLSKDQQESVTRITKNLLEIYHSQRLKNLSHKEIQKKINIAKEELYNLTNEIISSTSTFEGSLVSHLSKVYKDEDDIYLIRDEIITLLLAGHETSSNTITWALYQLAKNNINLESVNIDNLAFETLRLYPAVWRLTRAAIEDINYEKFKFKKGLPIYINIYKIQRNIEVYGDTNFNPTRWSQLTLSQLSKNFHFIPFGSHSRRCIGEHMALTEIKTILETLKEKNIKFKKPDKEINPIDKITLSPSQEVYLEILSKSV